MPLGLPEQLAAHAKGQAEEIEKLRVANEVLVDVNQDFVDNAPISIEFMRAMSEQALDNVKEIMGESNDN